MTECIECISMLSHPCLCVVGPTASGKTALAQKLAEQLSTAVLSADSMQIYRGMDIGTSKISPRDRTVPYYGLDIASPDEAYSVQRFQSYGRSVVEKLDEDGSACVICGGTGFYVRAIIDDFSFPAGEQVGNTVRDTYMRMAEERGSAAVWDVLNEVDPDAASVISPNDVKRVVRALEMHDEGISYADQKKAFESISAYYPAYMIGLSVDPDILRQRIDDRVDAMIAAGLLDEVKTLLDLGLRDWLTAKAAIGYKQAIEVLDGTLSLEEAVRLTKIATHQYAKRQRTWFRKDLRIHWLDANEIESPERLEELVHEALQGYKLYCAGIVDAQEPSYGA